MNKVANPPRTFLRIVVSAGLIAILLVVAHRQHVADRLREASPGEVILAGVVLFVAWAINSLRWNLLLRVAGIREKAGTLASLYFIGMFFSQILPTGAGGDAVRMWDLYRRGHQPAAVVVATLQERLLGMGVSMVIGLIAVAYYFYSIPLQIRPILVGLPIAAIAAVTIFLYPQIFLGAAARFGPVVDKRPALKRIFEHAVIHRITSAIRPTAKLPALTLTRLTPIVLVTAVGVLLSISVWWILGRAVGAGVSFGGYCLIVPLVWVIAMAPSLGGAGLREGGFVLLMTMLFGAAKDRALAIAALYLIVQLLLACGGGAIVLYRVLRGEWKSEL